MIKVIFLNGPPRSGKDTIARFLEEHLGATHFKFATPLKNAAHAMFGLEVLPEHYDSAKDEALWDFMDHTPRQVYIDLSEIYVKEHYHKEFFGQILLRSLIKTAFVEKKTLFVISDSGFVEEAAVIINKIGAENCLLVYIYREGCTYEKDSRSLIKIPGVDRVSIMNDGNRISLEMTAKTTISSWLREKQ